MVSPNRVTPLFDPSPVEVRTRTPAQKEASRRNGALSRGPLTDEGKSRSSLNAVKHGLLARNLTPAADPRGHDVLYRRLHKQLLHELQPRTFSEQALVDALAHDYLQLSRARAMSEILQQGPGLNPEEVKRWEMLQEARRERGAIRSLLAGLKEDRTGNCSAPVARRLAKLIVEQVEGTYEYLNPTEEVTPENELDEYEKGELQQMKDRWARIEPVRARLSDHENVVKLFTGRRHAWSRELKAVRHLLELQLERCRQQIEANITVERVSMQAQETWLKSLAGQPEKLLLIDRYVQGIERSIRLKLAAFDSR